MLALRPFWTFFGGKWRLTPHYPEPIHSTIIEPFAGAAGYSLRYPDRKVILIDKDPLIAGIWRWLISASAEEVRALPRIPVSGSLHDVKWPCEEAKNLAGFWLGAGSVRPYYNLTGWLKKPGRSANLWGASKIERIASQVDRIRHWTIIEGDYTNAPDIEATWFIDAPYVKAGKRYRHSSASIDFSHLGAFCQNIEGQVIVCEQEGADWMPFEFFHKAKANESVNDGKVSNEVVWLSPPHTDPRPHE